MNRCYFDLETSPNIGFFWRAGYKQFVNYDSIITERAIICACWKWEGKDKVHSLTWDKEQNDKTMLEKFVEEISQADEVVAHNGDGFDLPWLRTRCLIHDLQPMPPFKSIDTLQWARRKFMFNSNRLDYIGKFIGEGGKIKTELDLWKRIVLKRDNVALRAMVEYCKRDVLLLEKVYHKLEKYVPHKTHVGVMMGKDKWTSPFNGGTNVVANKKRVTAAGSVQYQMQCLTTGRYYTINTAAHRDYQEWRKEKGKL